MNIRRRTLAVALIAVGLSTIVAPAFAASFDSNNPLGPDAFVVLTGRLDLPRGSTASDAIIFDGDATIAGDVTNNVVAFNGDVEVTGHVGENVVALNGKVTLGPGARVDGDVVSADTADISPNATVGGRVRPVRSFDVNLGQFTVVSRILVWLATSVSSFLLGLLLILFVPRAMDRTARTGIDRVAASIGFGFLMLIGVPIVAFVAIGILVGIPFGVGVLLALGLLYWLGYTAGAYMLGRRLVAPPTHRLLAFLAGWGILRLLALIPVIGGLVWLAATVWGLGALVIAARTAGRETPDAAQAVVPAAGPPPPVPPPPPIISG
ncbi:MAG: hypothetical protein ACXWEG_04600 [Actinomycetota bacterium]